MAPKPSVEKGEIISEQIELTITAMNTVIAMNTGITGGSINEQRKRCIAAREIIALLSTAPMLLSTWKILLGHVARTRLLNGGKGYIKVRGLLFDLLGLLTGKARLFNYIAYDLEQTQPTRTKGEKVGARTRPEHGGDRDARVWRQVQAATTKDQWFTRLRILVTKPSPTSF